MVKREKAKSTWNILIKIGCYKLNKKTIFSYLI